ncbi:DUF1149 family protein [Enterococcus columbae]|uniref:Uncharacterized protein n=1 Tax=Enterococcus columbae DSM 7374 = ATCC 51263 TaxID=1121865 RepID=S1NUC3_9ENTE|nr:DUF1149 family protein [Enterococcus columbae]EOT44321.1 hypothetical protein OMW_00377 [Enterococcus columbae DSM 7374 = ATCC 51263]EOW84479.1 hypothetical protein I568_00975 [Enterococcus columbae DSM 7374 = ATCC 51263]OJG20931.1 hypothetical protein RR47_GL001497 [Enterococcus columbae DSM 7374 = ATCC 51263]
MEILREKPIVDAYHFDHGVTPDEQTQINVGFVPLVANNPEYPENNTLLGAQLEFKIILQNFKISGQVRQVNHIVNRKINSPEDLTQEESEELVEPLFDILRRLTYEVTEIITDEPGINLEFNSQHEQPQAE